MSFVFSKKETEQAKRIENPNPIKLGRCIKELERIYGIREGSAGISHTNYFNGNSDPKTEKELADKLGVTQQTIQNYKKLTELVPELQDWVETGIVTKDTAFIMTM